MKTNRIITSPAGALIIAALLASGTGILAGTNTPSRVSSANLTSSPYRTSGVIWGNGWRGSGTVAVNPRVAVSCAHLVYLNGWLSGFDWAAAYHSSSSPSTSPSRQALRGYQRWTSYSGGASDAAFSRDLVAHYAYTNLAGGAYAGHTWMNSTTSHPLNSSSVSKLIVGYPGSDGYYMNATGAFTSRYTSQYGPFFLNPSVKGGPGMSGGGVFAWTEGQWRLAGVHVSGHTDGSLGAGTRALDGDANNLINSAIVSSGGGGPAPSSTTRTFSSSTPLNIPDNTTSWTVRSLGVSGMPSNLTAATVSLNISHPYKGDLEVMVTAPNGRSVTLHNRTGGSADNVVITGQNLTGSFSGSNPNGTWKLSMRDLVRLDIGRLNSVSLTLTSR